MTAQKNIRMAVSVEHAVKSLFNLIVVVDERDRYCYVVDRDEDLINLIPGEEFGFAELCSCVFRNLHPENRQEFDVFSDVGMVHEQLSKKVHISFECRIRRKNKRYYWSEITICNTKHEDSPEGKSYLFLIRDIHEQKMKAQKETREMLSKLNELQVKYDELFLENMTDAQTGCFNRKGLKYSETRMLEEAKATGKKLFVCVLDLNGLKFLNDTYGHAAGDEAIRAVSDAIKSAAPPDSSFTRTGGDEFLILSVMDEGDTGSDGAGAGPEGADADPSGFGSKFEEELKKYNETHDNPYEVSASYGICLQEVSADMNSLDESIEQADAEMYRMKEETDPYMRK